MQKQLQFLTHITRLLAPVIVAAAFSATANDWPQFRGPDRDGISKETGLLKDWPAGGPPPAWKATGLGLGYSTLSVADGQIYTIGDRGDASFLVAIKEADGKPVWTAKLGESGSVGWGDFKGPRASPTVAGKFIYAVGQHGEIACFDAATGAEKWRKDYRKDFGGQLPEWGYSEAPLVDGDNVVVTPGGTDGSIVALAKDTGAIVWRSKGFADKPHYSSLVPAEIGGVRQYIQLTSEHVVGIGGRWESALERAAQRRDCGYSHADILRWLRLRQLGLRRRQRPFQNHWRRFEFRRGSGLFRQQSDG